jgi:sulfur-carrier protein
MLRLRFFASIRERLGRGEFELEFSPGCERVETLVRLLDASVMPGCARWIAAPNTLVAVNQVLGGQDSPVADGDEVAFYPPVTGG